MTGRYEEHLNGSWSTDVEWTYTWDVQDRLVCVEKDAPGTANDRKVEYRYCPSCGGEMTERIEYSDAGQTVSSWLRYEYDGLNLLRIDERYDDDSPPNGIDENDPWTCRNVFVHAPGQIGQVVRNRMYDYGWCFEELQYYYDALGNVVGYTDSTGGTLLYDMDAFGRAVPASTPWEPMSSPAPKEHLTGKMYDNVTGLYYFHARWYDPEVGRFVSRDPVRSRNHYVLSLCNPANTVDPDGRQPRVFTGFQDVVNFFNHNSACCSSFSPCRCLCWWDIFTVINESNMEPGIDLIERPDGVLFSYDKLVHASAAAALEACISVLHGPFKGAGNALLWYKEYIWDAMLDKGQFEYGDLHANWVGTQLAWAHQKCSLFGPKDKCHDEIGRLLGTLYGTGRE